MPRRGPGVRAAHLGEYLGTYPERAAEIATVTRALAGRSGPTRSWRWTGSPARRWTG